MFTWNKHTLNSAFKANKIFTSGSMTSFPDLAVFSSLILSPCALILASMSAIANEDSLWNKHQQSRSYIYGLTNACVPQCVTPKTSEPQNFVQKCIMDKKKIWNSDSESEFFFLQKPEGGKIGSLREKLHPPHWKLGKWHTKRFYAMNTNNR